MSLLYTLLCIRKSPFCVEFVLSPSVACKCFVAHSVWLVGARPPPSTTPLWNGCHISIPLGIFRRNICSETLVFVKTRLVVSSQAGTSQSNLYKPGQNVVVSLNQGRSWGSKSVQCQIIWCILCLSSPSGINRNHEREALMSVFTKACTRYYTEPNLECWISIFDTMI